jgi:hypothetical protein
MLFLVKEINRLAVAYYDPISIVSFAEKNVIFINLARPKEIKGIDLPYKFGLFSVV